LSFCYEAGPCGYGLYRQLLSLGHDCQVVAPSLIPKKPGERIKTDRRDASKLARAQRSGDLTAVWVPDEEQEAMRDLTRGRDDMKNQERKARQQLNAYVLRHGHAWPSNKTRWTQTHYNWLESLRFGHDWQQVLLQEYTDAVKAASQRVADITDQMERALPQWSLGPILDSLVALRGIDKLAAMVLLAELGDISRFSSPRQLMAYLGLVPSEYSSGGRRRQGPITKTGNSHARRMLVESAWSYRFPARQTMHLKRKAKNASDEARVIAWRAQKRLCGRYCTLLHAGKNTKQTTVAIARELVGFIWDIVCHDMPKVQQAGRQARV
jgi:transposase